ncbi:Berberine bridge enzyme [Heracleum sosnowskyi]|uniref:Berberine bridge enzyme n=1 Tax=Heracleum sosnowskyi TaxID=360622 RepID=A0AAD8M9W7_9APIA|nr:Berberine bridge enzyme [Heracleum sosnowskyi]
MKIFTCSILLQISFLLVLSFSFVHSANPSAFIKCLTKNSQVSKIIAGNVLTPSNSSYTETYEFSMRNPRFNTSERLKPAVIVTPVADSQVQTVVNCAKKFDMQIRIRSGGHDFEGLSYSSTYHNVPFVLLDMIKLKTVTVDAKAKTAIVQAGATLGEVYYWIYQASGTLAFPAGVWSTVGATGLICGGGYGPLRRKYGLAADNVIDARIVDVKGRILDRQAMGEDVFWAIRGGGCASFGIVLSWTLNLVDVPEKVTVFLIQRTLEQNATKIILPFQTIAPKLPNEVDIRVRISTIESPTSPRGKTVQLSFTGLYLGRPDVLLKLIQKKLPQLGMVKEDLREIPWINAIMESSFFNMFEDVYSPEDLLDRTFLLDLPTKAKSDFVRSPIPEEGIEGLWEKLLEVNPTETTVIFTPYGGRLDKIKESALPFPNRAGTLYMVYARVLWAGDTTKKLEWIRSLYNYLTPYVSNNPRRAYWNYDDIDLGVNPATGPITLADAKIWGKAYYKSNFDKLVRVKGLFDPDNFFRHEQSIPPFLPKADM